MAARGDELAPFLIRDVKGLEESAKKEEAQAGRGSFGYVFKVNVKGVERIAKKIHSEFVNRVSAEEKRRVASKFRDECIILSKLRHPNIVQFVGVHYGRGGMTDLTLFMECLSSDMDEFLSSTHPNLPLSLKLSLLKNISSGLIYLHCEPPIVHRDLTARNILISDRCQAKIADLGMAKIVDIQAQLALSHTQAPGQQNYMPPEALKENASCTPKLDIFSFGHLALYTVNQEFPKVYNVTMTMDILQQGISERLKRRRALDAVGEGHCLYPIITECLFDHPDQRPTSRDLNGRLCYLASQYPRGEPDEECDQLRKRVAELEPKCVDLEKTIRLKDDAFTRCHTRIKQQDIKVHQLQERNKEQAQLVLRLKREREQQSQRMIELEEMTATDKTAYENMLQDAKDERDKVKDDFENEIRALKMDVKQLNHELSLSKREAVEVAKRRVTEDDYADRVAQLERIIDSQKKQICELEVAKNEAADVIAVAKMEAEIYKADFLEERKDREKARGELAELEKKTGGQSTYFQEERSELYKVINTYKQQVSELRTEHARREATLQTELDAKQIEAVSNELDDVKRERDRLERDKIDLKHEVERRKASKHYKIKEYDRLKKQLHEASKGNVKLVDQVEGLRKQNKDLSKMIKKEQDRQRKAEKKSKTSIEVHPTEVEETAFTMAEQLESLESQIAELKFDVRHYQEVIETLKMGIRDGTVLFSPTDDEKSPVSPTTDQQVNTEAQSNPFQVDLDYIPSECDPNLQPEIGLREQLNKLEHQHKQMAPMQRLFEAGKGDSEPVQAPRKQEMECYKFECWSNN